MPVGNRVASAGYIAATSLIDPLLMSVLRAGNQNRQTWVSSGERASRKSRSKGKRR